MIDGIDERDRGGEFRSVVAIVALGAALGLAYNALGLRSEPAFGVAWIAEDKAADVFVLEDASAEDEGAAPVDGLVTTDDPLAAMMQQEAAASPAPEGLGEIPEIPRPIEMQLPMVKRYFDAGAALFVDARETWEYDEGHIPGAVNLPFDTSVTDPEKLRSIPAEGRPLIVYCGGGGCELSINLAWELLGVGHTRVVFFRGGYPSWVENGYPVATGAATEGA